VVRRYSKSDLKLLSEKGLGAVLPPPKPPRKNEEMKMQMAVISWWADNCEGFGVPENHLWHTPNSSVYGGSEENRARIGGMMKRQGLRDGVPDLFLANPVRTALGGFIAGLFVEMKTPTGVVSPAQRVLLASLECKGYATAVCRTVEDAQQVIRNYLRT
jgi:hypothetical protein